MPREVDMWKGRDLSKTVSMFCASTNVIQDSVSFTNFERGRGRMAETIASSLETKNSVRKAK